MANKFRIYVSLLITGLLVGALITYGYFWFKKLDYALNEEVAFKSGDYYKSRQYSERLAELGDTKIKYNMIFQYGLGLGGAIDLQKAILMMHEVSPIEISSQEIEGVYAASLGSFALTKLGAEKRSLGCFWVYFADYQLHQAFEGEPVLSKYWEGNKHPSTVNHFKNVVLNNRQLINECRIFYN